MTNLKKKKNQLIEKRQMAREILNCMSKVFKCILINISNIKENKKLL